jgi:hypothetical protein
MKDLTTLDYFERSDSEWVAIAFTRGQNNQFVYRVEVQDGSAHFYEHYNSLDGELNKRLAHEKFDEFADKFSQIKERA